MPRVRFLRTIEGDSTNRSGYEAGSEWHLSTEHTQRLLDGDAAAAERHADDQGAEPRTPTIEVLEADPVPVDAVADTPPILPTPPFSALDGAGEE